MHTDLITKLNEKDKQLLLLREETTRLLEDQRLRADLASKEFESAHRNDQQSLDQFQTHVQQMEHQMKMQNNED